MLIYDGECDFCRESASWAGAPAVSWQELGAAELARLGLSVDDVRSAAWWVDDHGRTFRGRLAIAHALVAAGGRRRVAGRLLLVPPLRWVAAAVYPLVARWRRFMPH